MSERYTLHLGDCIEVMRTMADNSVDSIVTDPPYHLTSHKRGHHPISNMPGTPHARARIGDRGFMGKVWDGGDIAHRVETWAECLRVLKPGGHLLAFAGSRTYHRMTCAIEDAGFEIRDMVPWHYGNGFPKSLDVSKAIDKKIESRYGKEKKCDCLDARNGCHAGQDFGYRSGEDVRIQRAPGESAAETPADTNVPIDGRACDDVVRDMRQSDRAEVSGSSAFKESLLLASMFVGGSEAARHGHASIRAGMEESTGGSEDAGQGVQMLRQDASGERVGSACASFDALSVRGNESSIEPRGAVRFVSSQDRSGHGANLGVDSDRREARRIVLDDNGGRREAVACVCSWCGRPDEQWLNSLSGLGTALKPATEPICMARKPLTATVAANVAAYGTGAINIDACRVHADDAIGGEYTVRRFAPGASVVKDGNWKQDVEFRGEMKAGRWPANVIHDGSPEVLEAFPDAPGQLADVSFQPGQRKTQNVYGTMNRAHELSRDRTYTESGGTNFAMKPGARRVDTGSAARFYYCAKASRLDRNEGIGGSDTPALDTEATMRDREMADWPKRNGNHHPTVKPTELMRYLARLVTPPGGKVLDPFMGSGSTGKGCMFEGFEFVGIDITPEYVAIAEARIAFALKKSMMPRDATGKICEPMPVDERQTDMFTAE